MRRACFAYTLLFVIGGLWVPSSAIGQQPEKAEPKGQPADTASEPKPATEQPKPRLTPRQKWEMSRERLGIATRELIGRIGQLQTKMKRELNLSEKQAKAVGVLCDIYVEHVKKQLAEEMAKDMPKIDTKAIMRLRGELAKAREAGDGENIRRIQKQMLALTRQPGPMIGQDTPELVVKLQDQLTPTQLEAFHKMIVDLQLVRQREFPNGLQRLLAIIQDPKLGLTEEQREAIPGLIRQVLHDTPKEEKGAIGPEELAKMVTAELLKKLPPEQGKILRELIKQADAQAAAAQAKLPDSSPTPETRAELGKAAPATTDKKEAAPSTGELGSSAPESKEE